MASIGSSEVPGDQFYVKRSAVVDTPSAACSPIHLTRTERADRPAKLLTQSSRVAFPDTSQNAKRAEVLAAGDHRFQPWWF